MDSEGTALTLANSSSSDADEYKIEFTLSVTRSTENSNSLSLTRHEDESRSYLGRLVRRCMAGIEDIHLLRRIGFHTSHRSFQSSGLMAGYGQLFKDDATLTTSCDNGTRQEEPGFVYLCSNFQF